MELCKWFHLHPCSFWGCRAGSGWVLTAASVLSGLDLHKNQDQEPWHPSHPAARSWPRTTIAEVRAGWGWGAWGAEWAHGGPLPAVGGCGSSRDGAEPGSVLSAAAPCECLVRKGHSHQCPCCCPDLPGAPSQSVPAAEGAQISSLVTKIVGDMVDGFTLHCCFRNELQNQSGQW